MPKIAADLTGQNFGIYEVLEKDLKTTKLKKRIYWKCKCIRCNSIRSVRADNLKRNPQSCPKCNGLNLTGQVFGKLTAIKRTKIDNHGHYYWLCKCDCGNIKEILGSNLALGYTISCGCEQKKRLQPYLFKPGFNLKDLTGQRFGKLTVIKRAPNSRTGQVKWQCECDCGTICDVRACNLLSGSAMSCGCMKSKGEFLIRQILSENNISFKTEYTFNDLPKRRFDVAVFNSDNEILYLIEYDGEQHFSNKRSWNRTDEEFQKSIQRDIEKNEYCQNHNIKLLRIPYYDYNKISMDYINQKLSELQ